MKILNFGSCNIDCVFSVDHIVKPGETLQANVFAKFPGGKGLNQAIAIAKAGVNVCFAGCVGSDDIMLRPILRQAGVDISNLLEVETPTGQAIIQVDEKGENSIIINRGANGAVTREYIDEVLKQFAEGDILLIQNEISNLLYLVKVAAARKMKILLNPSPFENSLKEIELQDLYGVILNEVEAMQWSGLESAESFLDWIKEAYPHLQVVLTLGKEGSILLRDGEQYHQPSFKVEVVDTTGAGDTFTGYYVAGLCEGLRKEKLMERASAAAAISVSRKGAASSIPSAIEVATFLENR